MTKKSRVAEELAKEGNISIINLVDAIVEEAYTLKSSDIHIDPTAKSVTVRMRIDGVLQDIYTLPKEIQSEIVTRIKVLAGLRTDEHQTPQDGRFRTDVPDVGPIDIRVAIAPTHYGENAVLRLLSENSEKFTLEMLGFDDKDAKRIREAIKKPYGMILVTGPTGSGKTTTLYTVLKDLNTKEVAIITIEDPIEYAIDGINQMQVNSRTGMTFANGLRSMLRQDPDIIMVGEIRDSETSGLAVNTALTGHLVLSTLHTSDAATTLPRLIDLGVEPYLITATVNVVIGQRLVRTICNSCKTKKQLTDLEKESIQGMEGADVLQHTHEVYHGTGCDECTGSGYKGRMGIYEVMPIDEPIREAMLRRCSSTEMRKIAIQNGMKSMIKDGFNKVASGKTTLEEVLRVIHE
ncbi:MAG: type II secretion system protein GspE [Candidatus Zambryskibacteria bacterium CG10_big_fil_rev_8_21_14_0_10_42_12]|uniref:Type II secretion system protein GspE n=1 Tax=Candidatus Zambryskibacteria bacterium CG10_big_fil_rev_8_21_14_0_10_42_12 TaxID=1975115 RepID=A0A2H0QVK9_9BACT|nr:MAG: type II secretion system protein GspE [Candidatus Zambryskibacteria bacterium CG10_big_fil_rev_8_21_14_0_10_42_12]